MLELSGSCSDPHPHPPLHLVPSLSSSGFHSRLSHSLVCTESQLMPPASYVPRSPWSGKSCFAHPTSSQGSKAIQFLPATTIQALKPMCPGGPSSPQWGPSHQFRDCKRPRRMVYVASKRLSHIPCSLDPTDTYRESLGVGHSAQCHNTYLAGAMLWIPF